MDKPDFVSAVEALLSPSPVERAGVRPNKTTIEKLGAQYGIVDKNLVKELTELAIVQQARKLAHQPGKTVAEKFANIVELYKGQVNLSHRTSQSVMLQQYSTPAPIGYLMGVFCGVDKPGTYLEPSAGNGLLTIAADPQHFYVNEIDNARLANLKTQGFMAYSQQDATESLRLISSPAPQQQFDAVLTNPPFGRLPDDVKVEGYPIKDLDHLMAIRALEAMKDTGRAAIIIGGHTTWDDQGRVTQGKNRIFFNYLNKYYNVLDVILIDGHSLYSRQGTSFDTRLILIDGRKATPGGVAPLKSDQDVVVKTFDELYDRVMRFKRSPAVAINNDSMKLKLKLKAKAAKARLAMGGLGAIVNEPELKRIFTESAEPFRFVKFNQQNYFTDFGTQGEINTPIGIVVIDFNDLDKVDERSRTKYFGLIKPTLTNPTLIVKHNERELFLKSFIDRKRGEIYFVAVAKDESGFFSLSSAHEKGQSSIFKKIREGNVTYQNSRISFTTALSGADSPLRNYITLEIGIPYTKVNNKDANLQTEELGMPYLPASNICNSLEVDTPDSMGYEIHLALKKLKLIVGNVEDYVQNKLGYATHTELCKALSAEQSDAVALAIYNIEQRKQALIVGDQTGIGKGRIAAAMVRYGAQQGLKPIFITEKPNLFSDLYRDLKAIGSETLKPYIVNSRESKTHVKDEDGTVVFEALDAAAQKKIIDSGNLPKEFDYVMLTYSQISGGEVNKAGNLIGKSPKGSWVERVAKGNIIVMDEAHNASGDSNTGKVLQDIIAATKGVTFLSATFAKRPDNMPIYAMKTAMSEANMNKQELIDGIEKGGVALQEVLSAQLVQHGQMIRRERSFEGIEVNYLTLDDKAAEHKAISDNITTIVRDIIAFQTNFIDKEVEGLDKIAAKTNTGSNVEKRKGTKGAGVDSTPYFSKVFQVINQMLFSIKAEAVADRAIMRLKEGKKPVIAFSSTMGSFIESLVDADGRSQAEDGTKINADFATVLQKGLDGVLRYTERDEQGQSVFKSFDVAELSSEAQAEYNRIAAQIRTISSGIVISPIDLIKQKLSNAGYRVAEVTGRKLEVQLREAAAGEALPETRAKQKGDVTIPPLAKKLIPPMQLKVVKELLQGEEGEYFAEKLAEIESIGKELSNRSLARERKAYQKTNPTEPDFTMNVAMPSVHYFNGGSDWYIYEWNQKDNVFFGYTILNGDTINAEFGDISPAEIFQNFGLGRNVEMDFYFTPKPLKDLLNNGMSGLPGAFARGPLGKELKKAKTRTIGIIKSRKKENANDAFRQFQNNEVDVLLINQSGSTGASAHALPNKTVPASQVKQRVMILLQAELDINTEVQKRGRINRTGQIYKPIYDYVFSAIPAEKRLMMMLQKKLKSLDANTTSNQKQSEAVLSVDDFLNKIGDRVVTQYLYDHLDINRMLNDPLGLEESQADSGKEGIMEDAAHRVSGRVAVLPTALQEKFYNELLRLYKEEVEYLKQNDEYDLEVDTLNLQAVTKERTIKIVGKGGQSAFGDNTYLEKCEVNILKKPYTVSELDALYKQAIGNSEPTQISADLLSRFESTSQSNLAKSLEQIREDYTGFIQNITNEKKYAALASEEERKEFIEKRTAELNEAREAKLQKETEKSRNSTEAISDFLRFFTIGRPLFYPIDMENTSASRSFAVCLGIRVDLNSEKPFLRSNMKLQIAIASGKKRIDIPLSKNKDVNAIMGASSYQSADADWDTVKNQWQASIKSVLSNDRGPAYIVTGNLLQSYGSDIFGKGRLISYTTADGKTVKGRLLPDGWEPGEVQSENLVKVPISKALKVIASLTGGKSITLDSGAYITKTYNDDFMFYVPASRSAGGEIYLDQELNAQMETGRFDKVSNYMRATFSASKIKKVIEILQTNHNASVGLLPYQLDLIMDEVEQARPVEVIPDSLKNEVDSKAQQRKEEPTLAPSPTERAGGEVKANVLRLRLALKAKAVKVKLKLAA